MVSLPGALDLLARKGHSNIYGETFVHKQRALRFPKGTFTYLLTHLGADFGCHWCKVGTDYLVYSKTWAEDRAADISQREIEHLASLYVLQGHYELKDYIAMARRSDRQLNTLEMALNIGGPFVGGNKNALRLLNALDSNDLPVAYSPVGALLTDLTPYTADLKIVFGKRPVMFPVHVKLDLSAKGVGIQFADQQGKSREYWAHQARSSDFGHPYSSLQPDGSCSLQ